MPNPDDIFHSHDHASCTRDAIARAEGIAQDQQVRLTPVRRRVLEILLEEHRAMGAYEVLDRLSAEGLGKQPPVAYRALDFLVEHGLAHRVQRLNAFTACQSPRESHAPAFLICRECRAVAEIDAARLRTELSDLAAATGFAVEHATIEAVGICPACAEAPGKSDAP